MRKKSVLKKDEDETHENIDISKSEFKIGCRKCEREGRKSYTMINNQSEERFTSKTRLISGKEAIRESYLVSLIMLCTCKS